MEEITERALSIVKRLTDNKSINIHERGTLRRAILLSKRQTGEWIDHSEDFGYVECPFCEHLTNCEGNIDELHYCWNCGAKLRKPQTQIK